MNKVALVGRTTQNVTVNYSGKGKDALAIANFTLAVNRKGKDAPADFIRCTAFGGLAETLEKWVGKGSLIAITGMIQTGSYENKNGDTVYTTDIIVDGLDFCDLTDPAEAEAESKKRK